MDQKFAFWLGLPVVAGMIALVVATYFAPNLFGGGTFFLVGSFLLLIAVTVTGIHTASSIRAGGSKLAMLYPGMIFPVIAVLYLVATFSLETDAMLFARADDGRFRPMFDVNGVAVGFVVDTDAKYVLLSQSDARRIGLDPSTMTFDVTIDGPNGPQPAAAVTLKSIILGTGRSMTDVPALVSANDLAPSTLGQDFFDRTGGWSIAGNTLTIVRPEAAIDIVPMALLLALSGAGVVLMLVQVLVRDHPSAQLLDALYPLAGILVAVGVGFHEEIGALGRSIYDQARSMSSGSEAMRIALGDDRRFHINLTVDGKEVDFMVDVATPFNVLRPGVPNQIGINPSSLVYDERIELAGGGATYAANVALPSVQFGATTIKDLRVKVFATDFLRQNILGKPFLDGFKYWRIEDDALIVMP